jgi:cbb3-type cytochrome oxidase maturation protein
MLIIALLIAISLTIAIGFLVVFIWNLRSGQYDDTYTPSVRMLFDNKPTEASAPDESIKKN